MDKVTLKRLGSVDLAELAAICQMQGRDSVPSPFWPARSEATPAQIDGTDDAVADRAGWDWMESFASADIWVECHVHYTAPDTPQRRILAFRAEDAGFFASQRPDEDVVDLFGLSPYELGAAVAASVGLMKPGVRPRVVIPRFVGYFAQGDDAFESRGRSKGFGVPVIDRDVIAVVPDKNVTAVATVQSRCDPARNWGTDWTKKFAAWVQIENDGDYLYTADFSHATPVAPAILHKRIDQLIAADVAVLRKRRGLV